jgi:hypothetical protein
MWETQHITTLCTFRTYRDSFTFSYLDITLKINRNNVKFKVLMAVAIKMTVSWNLKLCNLKDCMEASQEHTTSIFRVCPSKSLPNFRRQYPSTKLVGISMLLASCFL